MTIFPPSTIPHPWRSTLAVLAVSVWVTIALGWLITGPVWLWLIRLPGPLRWSPPVST